MPPGAPAGADGRRRAVEWLVLVGLPLGSGLVPLLVPSVPDAVVLLALPVALVALRRSSGPPADAAGDGLDRDPAPPQEGILARAPVPSPHAIADGSDGTGLAVGTFAATVLVSLLVVLAGLHRLGSALFLRNLAEGAAGFLGRWSALDPLFPLRTATWYVAGPLFFLAVRRTCRRPPGDRGPIRLLLLAAALAGGVALAQALTGRGLHVEGEIGGPVILRAPGLLPDPNAFGSFLALAFGVFCVAVRLAPGPAAGRGAGRPRGLRRRGAVLVTVLGGVAFAAAVWVSGSRTTLLAMAVTGLLVLGGLTRDEAGRPRLRGRRLLVPAAVLALVVAGLVAVASSGGAAQGQETSMGQRFLAAFDASEPLEKVLRGRPPLWRSAAVMVADRPLTGVGPGAFGRSLPDHQPWGLWGVRRVENAHNYYLQAAAELGLPAALILVTLLVAVGAALARAAGQGDAVAVAALAGGGAWVVTSLLGHPQLVPGLQLFFWGFLGIASAGRPVGLVPAARGLVLGCAIAVALPLGAWLAGAPPGPAFYSHGLYDREIAGPGVEPFRWARPRAAFVSRRAGDWLRLRFLVGHEELPVRVVVRVGDWEEARVVYRSGWIERAVHVAAGDEVRVDVEARPAFRPPGDPRELGVAVAPPLWTGTPPSLAALGWFPPETDADGRAFRWTSGIAFLPVAGTAPAFLDVRALHPYVAQRPVTLTLGWCGSGTRATLRLGDPQWSRVPVPARPAGASVLCIAADRTWNPRLRDGLADDRNLGVAVSLPGGEAPGAGLR